MLSIFPNLGCLDIWPGCKARVIPEHSSYGGTLLKRSVRSGRDGDAKEGRESRRPTLDVEVATLDVLSPVHTVAEKCDCRRKRRENGEIRRLSHFSATVWTGFYEVAVISRRCKTSSGVHGITLPGPGIR